MIKLLFADSRPIIREGIKFVFSGDLDIRVMAAVDTGAAVLQKLRLAQPDVVMLDPDLPGMDGFRCARIIRKEYPAVKVMVFTEYNDLATLRRANYAGVRGYLLKQTSIKALKAAIKQVYQGERVFDQNMDPKTLAAVKKPVKKKVPPARPGIFSPRELQVVELLSEGLTNQAISLKLGITQSTVETFRARIMAKSKKKNVAELIRWAVAAGVIR
ncbi:MAG: response regulator transcription factor [Bacteroidetes bacterium]|nr:response regulator transcription factor [Bacteroidota bacterium]